MNWIPTIIAAGAGITSMRLTGVVRRHAARRNLLDVPNDRSSHTLPTPRGGGLAIAVTFSASLLIIGFYRLMDFRLMAVLLTSGGIVATVGFLDDRHSLPAQVRFAAQIFAAGLFAVELGGIPESMLAGVGSVYRWAAVPFVVLALAWSTNLFNFMDGIDGIAGSEAAFIAGAGAWLNSMQHGDAGLTAAMMCLCAVSLGFLSWNWPPARIFMGDVGSGFLGIMLAMLGLAASQRAAIPWQVWIILGGLFLVDATVTLLRRAIRGDRWFEAHRLHAYQHLARRWNSHRTVTRVFIAINILWLLPWAWYAEMVPNRATVSVIAADLPLLLLSVLSGSGRLERGQKRD